LPKHLTQRFGALYSQLRGKRCQVFNSDMKTRVRLSRSTRFYYPDLSVVCQPNGGDETYQDNPVVIVEVISESTRRVDEYEKREACVSNRHTFTKWLGSLIVLTSGKGDDSFVE